MKYEWKTILTASLLIGCTPKQESEIKTLDNFANDYTENLNNFNHSLNINRCATDEPLELAKLQKNNVKGEKELRVTVRQHVKDKKIQWLGSFSSKEKDVITETMTNTAMNLPLFALTVFLHDNLDIYISDGIDSQGRERLNKCIAKNGVLHSEGSDFHCFDIEKSAGNGPTYMSLIFAPSSIYKHDVAASLAHSLIRDTVQTFFSIFDMGSEGKDLSKYPDLQKLVSQKDALFVTFQNELIKSGRGLPSHLKNADDRKVRNFFLGELVDSVHCSSKSKTQFETLFPNTYKEYVGENIDT